MCIKKGKEKKRKENKVREGPEGKYEAGNFSWVSAVVKGGTLRNWALSAWRTSQPMRGHEAGRHVEGVGDWWFLFKGGGGGIGKEDEGAQIITSPWKKYVIID